MNDREKLLALLGEFGVETRATKINHNGIVVDCLQLQIDAGNGDDDCWFEFTPDGAFHKAGVWEHGLI